MSKSFLAQAHDDFVAAKVQLPGETAEQYVDRIGSAAKAFVAAAEQAGIKVESKKPFHLDAVDVEDLMGDPDIVISGPHLTLSDLARETATALDFIDAGIKRVRSNLKLAAMTGATIIGMAAGGAPATAIVPVIMGAAGKIQ